MFLARDIVKLTWTARSGTPRAEYRALDALDREVVLIFHSKAKQEEEAANAT